MSRRWTRLPKDGTTYAYWQSCDGCLIETKPRFRRIGYQLMVPANVSGLDRNIYATYPSLRAAQAATDAPAAHAERAQQQGQSWQKILENTAAHHACA